MIFNQRPLAVLTIIFCVGIFLAHQIEISFLALYLLAVIILILVVPLQKYPPIFNIGLSFLVCILGMAIAKNSQNLSPCHITKYVNYATKEPYLVKGFIADEPQIEENRISFRLNTEEIQVDNLNRICCGQILARVKSQKNLHYGEELILRGDLYRPFSFDSSRRQSYRQYLRNQGIWFVMTVKSPADIFRLNKDKGNKIRKFAFLVKDKIENIIFQHVSKGNAGILSAMILGEKEDVPQWITNSMVKTGTIHILVVSGFNVGIVAFAINLMLKILRLRRRWRFCLAIPLLIFYCLVTGASNPVVRATVMALVFMSAHLLKREPDIYNSLSIAALFILAINPQQLFDIGFELSFVSVLAIVGIYPQIRKMLKLDTLKIKLFRFVLEGFLVSFSAWLGTMGFIAYYFKIFAPVTVLSNIFIVPLASLITLCGFSLVITGWFLPVLTPYISRSSELLVLILVALNNFFVKLPGAYFYLQRR